MKGLPPAADVGLRAVHQPGARAQGGHGRQVGGAGHAAAPPTTSTVPTDRLWSSAPLGRSSGCSPSAVSSQTSGVALTRRRDADGHDHDLAATGAAWGDEMADLGGVHGHGEVGVDRRPVDLAGAGAHAAGDVDGDDRRRERR